jgi:hypothetical protein
LCAAEVVRFAVVLSQTVFNNTHGKKANRFFFDIDKYDFYARFRMTKHVVNAMLMRIENEIRFRTDRNEAMTPLQQFLITLRFYATGTFQIVSGDLADVRKSSVCKAVLKKRNLF